MHYCPPILLPILRPAVLQYGGTVYTRDASSVGPLDTLPATDGMEDTIPDTSVLDSGA